MTDSEIAALLHDIDSDRVERKESAKDSDKIGQALCAFANDLPGHAQEGVLIVGARDDGSCAGWPVTEDLLQTLAGFKTDGNIQPIPSLIVEKRKIEGCDVAVVRVRPSEAPPVRYKGRAWVRVGPRRGLATPQEERILSERRRHRDLPFDLQPVRYATIDDLDLDFFQRIYLPSSVAPVVLAQNQRSPDQQLASLRFVNMDVAPIPTVLGLLAIGKEPDRFLGGDYIQFLRIDGTELSDPIRDEKRISGQVGEMLRMIDEVFAANISTAVDLTSGPIERRRPDYPLAALQQVIRNAVMHRNYEGTNAPIRVTWFNDRIEILSPGGPYGQVTVENFGTPGITDYRNRNLAEVLKSLGYVQRFGVGISIANQAMERNGNPRLQFGRDSSYVQAILRRLQ